MKKRNIEKILNKKRAYEINKCEQNPEPKRKYKKKQI